MRRMTITMGLLGAMLTAFPAAAAGVTTIDVLVVYTQDARAGAGGTSGIEAAIDLAVAETNNCYVASGIDIDLRLVGTAEVAYTESGSLSTDINRLRNPSDGYMDDVHALRDSVGADMVNLFVENGGGGAGIATINATASSAFSVVVRQWATSNRSFPHELGHNIGCAHDRDNASVAGYYSYSWGWRFTGASQNTWRTVMAYSPGTRIGHFSNPGIAYDGAPTGVSVGQPNEAHNALTHNNRASTVAGFRDAVDPNEAPTASFTHVVNGDTVSVDGTGSSDPDGTITSWFWNFGDGGTASGSTASHTYAADGSYTVSLTVTDDDGDTDMTSAVVTVEDSSPTASIDYATSGLTVMLDGTGSTPGSGSIESYDWDFGDGTTGSGGTTSHAYAAPGGYTATLTVTDSGGGADVTSRMVYAVGSSFTLIPSNPGCHADASGIAGGASGVTYAWSTTDGQSGSGPAFEGAYNGAGYAVSLALFDGTKLLGSWSGSTVLWPYTKSADVSPDGIINIIDILALKPVFGTSVGNPVYDPAMDFNSDGTINIIDILALKPVFGLSFWTR